MSLFNYFFYLLLGITYILTIIQNRRLSVLNNISKTFTTNFRERQNYEVVMQPKWHLYIVIILILLWGTIAYFYFFNYSYWGILYAIIFYSSTGIFSYFIPFPSKKYFLVLYFNTTKNRLQESFKYTEEEMYYLTEAYQEIFKQMKDNGLI